MRLLDALSKVVDGGFFPLCDVLEKKSEFAFQLLSESSRKIHDCAVSINLYVGVFVENLFEELSELSVVPKLAVPTRVFVEDLPDLWANSAVVGADAPDVVEFVGGGNQCNLNVFRLHLVDVGNLAFPPRVLFFFRLRQRVGKFLDQVFDRYSEVRFDSLESGVPTGILSNIVEGSCDGLFLGAAVGENNRNNTECMGEVRNSTAFSAFRPLEINHPRKCITETFAKHHIRLIRHVIPSAVVGMTVHISHEFVRFPSLALGPLAKGRLMDPEENTWGDFFESVESGRSDEKLAFDAVWRDHFWGHEIKGMAFAHDLEGAIEQTRGQDADGVPIHSLQREDEFVEGLSGGYTVRAARILVEIDGELREETIPALTWSMAIDLARDMFEPHGTVLGLQEGVEAVLVTDRDALRDRPDIPLGWERVLG